MGSNYTSKKWCISCYYSVSPPGIQFLQHTGRPSSKACDYLLIPTAKERQANLRGQINLCQDYETSFPMSHSSTFNYLLPVSATLDCQTYLSLPYPQYMECGGGPAFRLIVWAILYVLLTYLEFEPEFSPQTTYSIWYYVHTSSFGQVCIFS